MILLDTDHISVLQHPDSPQAAVLAARLQDSVDREIVLSSGVGRSNFKIGQ